MSRRERRAQWRSHHRASESSMPSVRLHIDELVLHDVDARHRYRVADAAMEQMADLLSVRPPDVHRSTTIEDVRASHVTVPMSKIGSIGAQVGTAIHDAVCGAGKR